MRNRNTIEFLGLWESLHNPNFNRVQFDTFRTEAGLNRFVMTPSKWVENTGSIGITAKAGRYGGTYAHSDIAMEFASWISAEFKLYLMKDYRRLKFDENSRLSLSWNLNREISKLNYRVHTNAIQQNLLPPDLTREQQSFVYADEADMLNVALFGLTAAQWRSQTKGARETYVTMPRYNNCLSWRTWSHTMHYSLSRNSHRQNVCKCCDRWLSDSYRCCLHLM